MAMAEAKRNGPKTEAGKQKSSLNSRKHGLYANTLVFQVETERKDFESLAEGFQEDYSPRNATEELMVSRIATMHWRVLQAVEREQTFLDEDSDGDPTKFTRAITAAERSLDRANKELENYRNGKLDVQPPKTRNYETNPAPKPQKPKAENYETNSLKDQKEDVSQNYETNPAKEEVPQDENAQTQALLIEPSNGGNYETNPRQKLRNAKPKSADPSVEVQAPENYETNPIPDDHPYFQQLRNHAYGIKIDHLPLIKRALRR